MSLHAGGGIGFARVMVWQAAFKSYGDHAVASLTLSGTLL